MSNLAGNNKEVMGMEFFDKVAGAVLRKTGLDADGEDLLVTFKATLEYMAEVCGDNKSEEGFELTLPGFLTFTVSQRDGNFGMGLVAEEELKKRIKDDDMLSDDEE